MSEINELRSALLDANNSAQAKINEAMNSTGVASDAALAEAQRLLAQAKKLNQAILEWSEGRFLKVVSGLEDMVAEERRAQSDILGRIETVAETLRASAGLAPVPAVAPISAPRPVARALPAVAQPPAPVVIASPGVDPNNRDVDPMKLHPVVREKVQRILSDLTAAKIPMKVFEAHRTPERQRMLFNKGRSAGVIVDRKEVVTFADAWRSYHQYGLAVDLVIDNPPMNMWETTGEAAAWWEGYHEIARKHGLEPLSFELPHIQITGAKSSSLLAGEYPEGGDESWADTLMAAINRWPEADKPPLPEAGDRPAISVAAEKPHAPTAGIDWAALPTVRESGFLNKFGGQSWRVDQRGVFLTELPQTPLRTPGTPQTASRVVELYGGIIAEAAAKYGIAPELLIMTIATETGIFQQSDFTGPDTFRWEAHFKVRNTGDASVDGSEKGDYSAGPMQVMADTARGVNRLEGLGYNSATAFQFFKNKPSKAPAKVGLYDPATCIDVGACFIRRQFGATEANPILVAAAYNAGSIRASGTNIWGIHVHGDHLDRAAKWFGDACEVMVALGR